MFEHRAHEALLLPLDLDPLPRGRMARAQRGQIGYRAVRRFGTERRTEAEAALRWITDEGPLAAAHVGNESSRSGWWEWSDVRQAQWLS